MNKKIKIVTVVGTRPELIRLSRVISTLEKNVDHINAKITVPTNPGATSGIPNKFSR